MPLVSRFAGFCACTAVNAASIPSVRINRFINKSFSVFSKAFPNEMPVLASHQLRFEDFGCKSRVVFAVSGKIERLEDIAGDAEVFSGHFIVFLC